MGGPESYFVPPCSGKVEKTLGKFQKQGHLWWIIRSGWESSMPGSLWNNISCLKRQINYFVLVNQLAQPGWYYYVTPFCGKSNFYGAQETHTTTRISLTTLQSVKNNCIKNTLCVTLRANGRNNSQVRLHVDKSLTGFKLWATAPNNMQQRVQTDATRSILQCCELMANSVASVCTWLYGG